MYCNQHANLKNMLSHQHHNFHKLQNFKMAKFCSGTTMRHAVCPRT